LHRRSKNTEKSEVTSVVRAVAMAGYWLFCAVATVTFLAPAAQAFAGHGATHVSHSESHGVAKNKHQAHGTLSSHAQHGYHAKHGAHCPVTLTESHCEACIAKFALPIFVRGDDNLNGSDGAWFATYRVAGDTRSAAGHARSRAPPDHLSAPLKSRPDRIFYRFRI